MYYKLHDQGAIRAKLTRCAHVLDVIVRRFASD